MTPLSLLPTMFDVEALHSDLRRRLADAASMLASLRRLPLEARAWLDSRDPEAGPIVFDAEIAGVSARCDLAFAATIEAMTSDPPTPGRLVVATRVAFWRPDSNPCDDRNRWVGFERGTPFKLPPAGMRPRQWDTPDAWDMTEEAFRLGQTEALFLHPEFLALAEKASMRGQIAGVPEMGSVAPSLRL